MDRKGEMDQPQGLYDDSPSKRRITIEELRKIAKRTAKDFPG